MTVTPTCFIYYTTAYMGKGCGIKCVMHMCFMLEGTCIQDDT